MSAAARRRRMLARRARGAHAMTVHGPLERVVRRRGTSLAVAISGCIFAITSIEPGRTQSEVP
jgi:hypothetical protein